MSVSVCADGDAKLLKSLYASDDGSGSTHASPPLQRDATERVDEPGIAIVQGSGDAAIAAAVAQRLADGLIGALETDGRGVDATTAAPSASADCIKGQLVRLGDQFHALASRASPADECGRVAELAHQDAVFASILSDGSSRGSRRAAADDRGAVSTVASEMRAQLQQPRVLAMGGRTFTFLPAGVYDDAAAVAAQQYVPRSPVLIETQGTVANLCKVMDAVHAHMPVSAI